ncbi:MAG TPA: 8-amino-7-oxononanoate synthase [Urbifossiella sp.]|jgi:7-keto-8-aminopelargonate synthetase-like enzyme
MSLFNRWSNVLEELREQERYRSFRLPTGIDFTSNDYLGYGSSQPRAPLRGLRVAANQSGTSSRLLRGHHAVWDEVETMLAEWHGAEAVLMMNSGYNANEGLIATLAEPGDWVAADELSHACIVDGLRLARPRKFLFKHNDLNHLEEGLKSEAAKRPAGREMFIVTESLFSMDGDTAPLEEIAELANRYGAHVVVDEAHSTGCFGERGAGTTTPARSVSEGHAKPLLTPRAGRDGILASVHTGGKALGLHGAYICGSKLLKEYLVNRCRHLIFTTALPAAIGEWWLERIPQIQKDDAARSYLHLNAAIFRNRLGEHGIHPPGSHYVVPVIVGQDEPAVRAAKKLQEQGFDVRAIRPPSVPHGTCRLRISIHADHDPAVLLQLADAVAEAVRS